MSPSIEYTRSLLSPPDKEFHRDYILRKVLPWVFRGAQLTFDVDNTLFKSDGGHDWEEVWMDDRLPLELYRLANNGVRMGLSTTRHSGVFKTLQKEIAQHIARSPGLNYTQDIHEKIGHMFEGYSVVGSGHELGCGGVVIPLVSEAYISFHEQLMRELQQNEFFRPTWDLVISAEDPFVFCPGQAKLEGYSRSFMFHDTSTRENAEPIRWLRNTIQAVADENKAQIITKYYQQPDFGLHWIRVSEVGRHKGLLAHYGIPQIVIDDGPGAMKTLEGIQKNNCGLFICMGDSPDKIAEVDQVRQRAHIVLPSHPGALVDLLYDINTSIKIYGKVPEYPDFGLNELTPQEFQHILIPN